MPKFVAYEVVSKIEDYREFVPWLTQSSVKPLDNLQLSATMIIQFAGISTEVISLVKMEDNNIEVYMKL